MASLKSEYDKLTRNAIEQGWQVRKSPSGRGRDKLISPKGYQVVLPNNPREHRGLKNFRTELMRMGYEDIGGKYTPPLIRGKEEIKVTEPTSNVGEALQAAQAVEERKQDHTASGATRRYFRENPGKAMTIDEVTTVVKARFSKANKISVQQAINEMARKGDLIRVDRGVYRYFETKSAAATATALSPPPIKVTTLTGDSTLDEDLELIDQALVALAEIESVVRRVHAKVAKLAELKKILGS